MSMCSPAYLSRASGKFVAMLCLLMASSLHSTAQPSASTFDDEFPGTTLDASKWMVESFGGHNQGNFRADSAFYKPEAIQVRDHTLHISVEKIPNVDGKDRECLSNTIRPHTDQAELSLRKIRVPCTAASRRGYLAGYLDADALLSAVQRRDRHPGGPRQPPECNPKHDASLGERRGASSVLRVAHGADDSG